MPATSPAVESLLRAFRYGYRLPFLIWDVYVHLPVLLVLIATGDDGRRPIGHAASRLCARMLLRVFGMRVEAVGTPRAGGTLFVANHISWVDIVALHSQHMMGFIAKAEIRGWPVVGWITSHAETIYPVSYTHLDVYKRQHLDQ